MGPSKAEEKEDGDAEEEEEVSVRKFRRPPFLIWEQDFPHVAGNKGSFSSCSPPLLQYFVVLRGKFYVD